MRIKNPNFTRALPGPAAVTAAAVLAFAAAGCGSESTEERTTNALSGLYAIDHAGANPTGDALAPYEKAFATLRADCEGSVENLVSSIQDTATDASNGSGTTISSLEAMRAIGRYLEQNPQPTEDCAGVFVGVEAYLEGGALG